MSQVKIFLFETKKDKKNIFRVESVISQATGECYSLQDFLLKELGVVYAGGLNHSFFEIHKELKKLGYRNCFEISKSGQYSIVYNSGNCRTIKIKKPTGELVLVNFESKFLKEFSDFETNSKLVNYSIGLGRNSYSLGRDSFIEWLKMHYKCKGQILRLETCERLFRENYPVFTDTVVERAKESVYGYQLAKKGMFYNCFNYDICSSFPSQLLNDTPVGFPISYKTLEEVPENYFYIVKFIAIKISLKRGLDFLNCDGKDITTLVLTKHLFQLFKKNYTYNSLKIMVIKAFKTRKGVFTDFIKKNAIDGKIGENDKVISKYNKAIVNSIVGYFGRNTEIIQIKLVKNGIRERTQKIPPIYLPVYLYVNGKAKAEFIEKIQGIKGLIYANTDGFITTEKTSLERLNLGRFDHIGSYELKNEFSEIYIETINGYTAKAVTGEIDNTLSGMRITDKIEVEDFKIKNFKYLVTELTPNGLRERTIAPPQSSI